LRAARDGCGEEEWDGETKQRRGKEKGGWTGIDLDENDIICIKVEYCQG